MTRSILSIVLALVSYVLQAQYAPAAGMQGSTAIHKDSSAFKAWASACNLQLGWQDIADTTLGKTNVGDSISAIGAANNTVVSLGDAGIATLTFNKPVVNGTGFDFAVFENGFTTGGGKAFLELAFVEVSSNGVDFVRFPATTHIQDTTQLAMEGVDCALLNNFAGKYVSGYGTPFDLEELANESNLDVNNITHVRVIDVVGSISDLYATYDSEGNKVNDPYPTAFPSSGFDLDAVGVINQKETSTDIHDIAALDINVYPNPTRDIVHISTNTDIATSVLITDLQGKTIKSLTFNLQSSIDISDLNAGLYLLHFTNGNKFSITKLLVE